MSIYNNKTGQPQEVRQHKSAGNQLTWARILIIIGSGLTINLLSDLILIPAPIILVGFVILLLAMFAVESFSSGADRAPRTSEVLEVIRFCLASLILGSAITGLWILPLFEDRIFSPLYPGFLPFHNYELGAASVIAGLAAIAAMRQRPLMRIAAFLASAVTGMSLVVSLSNERTEFTLTFIGWLAFSIVFVTIAALLPDIIKILLDFLGPKGRRTYIIQSEDKLISPVGPPDNPKLSSQQVQQGSQQTP